MSRLIAPGADEDPALNPKLSASAFDFLLIELVPMAYRLHAEVTAREEALATQASLLHLFPARKNKRRTTASGGEAQAPGATAAGGEGGAAGATSEGASAGKKKDGKAGGGAVTTAAGQQGGAELAGEDDETVREAVYYRLDMLGYRVGQGLVERFAADQPRPTTHLDSIKFICKELWTRVFRKQIDNLKTNHRGTFVLTDTRFQPLTRMSADRKMGPRAVEIALTRAHAFLWFPCGVIRGALAGLGVDVTVNAETAELPIVTFQIRVVGAKP